MGATITIAGKAIEKATAQARNQIASRLETKPTFRALITKDIRDDISSAIKNANAICWYFLDIIYLLLTCLYSTQYNGLITNWPYGASLLPSTHPI
jgi:hypothetical protein